MGILRTGIRLFSQRMLVVGIGRNRPLFGLHKLERQIRNLAQQTNGAKLNLDFESGMMGAAGREQTHLIDRHICQAMLETGIYSLAINFNCGLNQLYYKADFPDRTIRAAVRCAFRHLTMIGIPPQGAIVRLDLSYNTSDDTGNDHRISSAALLSTPLGDAPGNPFRAIMDFVYSAE
ncbi:hypothetical protein HZC35_04550 [Candidatus Saganbacteria bacterium]|nr:hypothetical protein [Candidatus Saganbacteria bacterium]